MRKLAVLVPFVVGLAGCVPAQVSSGVSPPTAPATTAMPPAPSSSRIDATTPVTTASSLPAATSAVPSSAPARGTALAVLATLPVKGRAPRTGYDRSRFGPAWADVDRNGCDTRNDILRRDLEPFYLKAGTHGCLVLKGTLHDPYSGRTVSFVRGTSTSWQVQIDHVVALSDAWQKGAQQLSAGVREAFANDPLNLLAVSAAVNDAKGDGDAATWLPPVKGYRCAYVARQVAVKAKYHLWVTSAERAAIARILGGCPTQKAPTSAGIPLGGGTVISVPTAPAATQPPAPSGLDPRFATCKAAKAAGYGPYYAGKDPEYAWYRDADGDGIVCE